MVWAAVGLGLGRAQALELRAVAVRAREAGARVLHVAVQETVQGRSIESFPTR